MKKYQTIALTLITATSLENAADTYPKRGSSLHQFVTIHLTEDGQEMVE